MRIFGNGNYDYYPPLGDCYSKRYFLVKKWWEHPVMVINKNYISRKAIVLGAANQDGGAHVDFELNDNYGPITLPGISGSIVFQHNGIDYERPLFDTHLISLRQMGYEILSSPSILALTHV
jgi:hypothetical protein